MPNLPLSLPDEARSGMGVFHSGAWQDTGGADTVVVQDPATSQELAKVSGATPADAVAAGHAAIAAAKDWALASVSDRARVLDACARALRARSNDLASVVVAEAGKPLVEAEGEVATAATWFEWYAQELGRARDYAIPPIGGKLPIVTKHPFGVVLAITPWNDPVGLVARKLAPAMAAGCTVVLKPSSQTPLSAIFLFNLLAEAGVPPGVVNMFVTSNSDACVQALTEAGIPRKLTFTGSTESGTRIAASLVSACVPASLELGGNAAFMVLDDADIEHAADGALSRKFRAAGQGCTCVNRLFVHEDLAQSLTETIASKMAGLQLGHGLDSSTNLGPVRRSGDVERLGDLAQEAVTSGASIRHQGSLPADEALRDGNFVAPILLTDVTDDMRVAREEIFGPILPILTFSDDQEALRRANDVPHGLAGYIYSQDADRALKLAADLDVGLIGINDPNPQSVQYPVGGIKKSGFGVEGGRAGLDEYRTNRSISMRLP